MLRRETEHTMPVSFQYLDKVTGEPVSLSRIDEEMCKETEETVSEKTYSWLFQALQWTGMAIVSRSGGSVATEEGFNEYVEDHPEEKESDFHALAKEFLIDRYTFSCWR
jgi:hypothetical protein